MLGDGNNAISTLQETLRLFWLNWRNILSPLRGGHFFWRLYVCE
ncbi:hypothetical protein UPM260_1778 [Salmonella enterica subsp. enterica serovar Typhimurium]|nr:hypothetical protein UPM260_1778 [Salmonella enterica subsp. enterica serovar Typhimurium]